MTKKLLIVSVAALCASSALLAAGPNNPANFETAKAKMSEMADKRMAIIKEFKSCVQSAKDSAALKECRKKEGDAMRALRPQNEAGAPPANMGGEPRPPMDGQKPPMGDQKPPMQKPSGM